MRRLTLLLLVLFVTLFFQSSRAWSTDRFVNLGDGTVLDITSHLRWLKNANCTATLGGVVKNDDDLPWDSAQTWSHNLVSGACGLADGSVAGEWRQPTLEELQTLSSISITPSATLNATGLFADSVLAFFYWTSSSDPDNTANAFYIWMGTLPLVRSAEKSAQGAVWPVRNGLWVLSAVSVAPTVKTFGSVTTGTTSASQVFTISNTGTTGDLIVSSITLTGGDSGMFALNSGDGSGGTCGTTPVTIASGTACTISAAFSPTAEGAKATTLRIVSNDVSATNKDIPLSGTGVSPPVSWWKAENNANDSVGSNHGTLNGGVAFTTGKIGQAFSFDGSQAQYVAVPSSPSLNILGNHSIAFWVKLGELPATDKTCLLVSKWTNGLEHKQVSVGPDGKLNYFLFGTTATSGVSSAAALQTGVWTHVAATYDGTNMKLYINGVQNASTLANNDVGDSTGTLYLGHHPEISWSQNFKGQLDEVGWYNRTLSQEEITVFSNSAPDSFSFPPQINSPLTASIESGAITVSGISSVTGISVSGGEYAISTDNGSTWGSWTNAPGMVSLNSQVKLRLTSASVFNTQTTAILTIGGASGAFTVKTLRFVDLGDGTVLDTIHSLRWLKNAACTDTAGGIPRNDAVTLQYLNWADAQTWSNNLASGLCSLNDRSAAGDWHLPFIYELVSLTSEPDSYRPDTLATAGFTNVQSYINWSCSIYTSTDFGPDAAWVLYMGTGYNDPGHMSNHYDVWPVRAGQYWAVGPLVTLGNGGFGNLAVGSVSSGHQFTVKNTAATAQPVSGIALNGTDANQFTVATGGSLPCSSLTPTLAAGASCTVMVTATSASVGAKTANLSVTTAAGSTDIPLTVTAIYPVPTVTSISPSSGFAAGGTYVTISGTNFSGATAVKFASTNAPGFAASSATQLIATSPAGVVGQTVDITVTTAGGTSVTSSADQFSYTLQYQAQNQSTNPYTPYTTLAGAISAALAGAEIRAYGGQFDGVFSLVRDIILNGGYNMAFSAKDSLSTTLNGNLSVDGGIAKVDSVTVKGVLTIKGGSLQASGVVVQ